jgi:hypothetical protein
MCSRIAKISNSRIKTIHIQGLLFSRLKAVRLLSIKIKAIQTLRLQVSKRNQFRLFLIVMLKIKLGSCSPLSYKTNQITNQKGNNFQKIVKRRKNKDK